MKKKWFDMLVCPVCKGHLIQKSSELICCFDRLAYPIRDGIPVMLEEEARALSLEEKEALQK
ncbi:MAG: Trm112 family protein [Legionellaceae bacterium]|nr:Trm112 family protein [Legionellaceae bacterium]